MFSRDKSAEGPQSVEIALGDGQTLSGKIILPPGRSLSETLNGAVAFIEFEPFGGSRTYLAKSALHSVTPTAIPAAPDLWAGPTEGPGFDPFRILGVNAEATREEVRDAYLKLAKVYHPDRYAAADLPPEVRSYLSAMVRRINAAHDAIQARQRQKSAKQEPVFTSQGRG